MASLFFLCCFLFYVLARTLLQSSRAKVHPPRTQTTRTEYGPSQETRELLYRMCAGDIDLAHRMVGLEFADTEEQRWKRAIYRLERDRS